MLFSFLTAVPGLILGCIALWEISKSQGRLTGRDSALAGIIASLVFPSFGLAMAFSVLEMLLGASRNTVYVETSKNKLREASIGYHFHLDYKHRSPNVATTPGLQKALSWRVHLLPYVGEALFYSAFDKNQPWDYPTNIGSVLRMPEVYSDVARPEIKDRSTLYSIFNADTASPIKLGFEGAITYDEFEDGSSSTIAFIEMDAESVPAHWIAGYDYEVDLSDPKARLLERSNQYLVAFADGSVVALSSDIDPQVLANMMGRNDGAEIDRKLLR